MDPHVVLTGAETSALLDGRHVVPVPQAVFRIAGPGAVDCLQGMVTNDLVRAGVESLIWGALLTPKGMIVSDCWVHRDAEGIDLLVPLAMRDTILALLRRSVPPRLAKVTDRTDAVRVRWLLGRGHALPDQGGWAPSGAAPFAALLVAPGEEPVDGRLQAAGWLAAPAAWADAARLLEGWPTLGREIDEKTLPQEVRFDELGGVRYDKGCYTGQETVARLHFRGHANRTLRGLLWTSGDAPADEALVADGKAVGTIRTLARFGERRAALAPIRREVATGARILAGGAEALVIEPPEWGAWLRAG